MPLRCNIDGRGKLVRLICGCFFLIAGMTLLLAWAMPSGSVVSWLVVVGVILAGAFAVFESRAGWCAIRALGLKTPL